MAVTTTKTCRKCESVKDESEFPRNSQSKDGRHPWCKSCKNARSAGYYARWTDEQRLLHRARVVKSRYGISVDLLRAIFEKQEGCCAICGKAGVMPASSHPNKKEVLVIDHDRASGEVRGLLCDRCNVGIGCLGHEPDRLVSAAHYLIEAGRRAEPSQS